MKFGGFVVSEIFREHGRVFQQYKAVYDFDSIREETMFGNELRGEEDVV